MALDELEPRLIEALPWLFLRFEGFDVEAMTVWAKTRDLQNRLGFTVSLARQVAERHPSYRSRLDELRRFEALLERSRLVREDGYGRRADEPGHAQMAARKSFPRGKALEV